MLIFLLDWTRGDTPGRESVVCSHDMLSVPNNSGEVLVGRTGVQKVVLLSLECICKYELPSGDYGAHTQRAVNINEGVVLMWIALRTTDDFK